MTDEAARVIGWDESTRPHVTPAGDAAGTGMGATLVLIHDMFRRQLDAICEVRDQVKAGAVDVAALRAQIHDLTLRQAFEEFGSFCAQYCYAVNAHHSIEDQHMFPELRRSATELAPVLDRLSEEHVTIHQVLVELDRAAVRLATDGEDFGQVDRLVDVLASALRSHLSYEEQQLVRPLSTHAIVI